MAELKTPTSIQLDYVVEILHNNNPQTISSYHYETFEKGKAHYERVLEGSTEFAIFSLDTITKREGKEDFKRLVLAKAGMRAGGSATEVKKELVNETRATI